MNRAFKKPHTPLTSYVSVQTRHTLEALAEERGVSLSRVIRDAFRAYLKTHQPVMPSRIAVEPREPRTPRQLQKYLPEDDD